MHQAKDQKLGRDVAIKVLPEEFARDADRVARLQRDAKLLADGSYGLPVEWQCCRAKLNYRLRGGSSGEVAARLARQSRALCAPIRWPSGERLPRLAIP